MLCWLVIPSPLWNSFLIRISANWSKIIHSNNNKKFALLCTVEAILNEGLNEARQETPAKTECQILDFCKRFFIQMHSRTIILDIDIQKVRISRIFHNYHSSVYCSRLSNALNWTYPIQEWAAPFVITHYGSWLGNAHVPNVNAYRFNITQTARNTFPVPGTTCPSVPTWIRLDVPVCSITASWGYYRRTSGNKGRANINFTVSEFALLCHKMEPWD